MMMMMMEGGGALLHLDSAFLESAVYELYVLIMLHDRVANALIYMLDMSIIIYKYKCGR